jgi:hypothetical protein
MPISRNRKKKSTNNFKTRNPSVMNLHEILNIHMNNCRECGGKRDEFAFDELPDEEQEHWNEPEIKDSIDCFLHCPNCEEYSAIFEVEEF